MFVIPGKAISDINVPMVYREESKALTAARLAGYADGLTGVSNTMRRGFTSVWITLATGVTKYANVTLVFNNMPCVILRKKRPSYLLPAAMTPVFPVVESVYAKLIPRRVDSCS